MTFPNTVVVTDQEVDLRHLSDTQKNHFVSLSEKLIALYEQSSQQRLIVSMSGPSGAGKSVTSAILEALLKQSELSFAFYTADLDAFHFSEDYLVQESLQNSKGRYDTYDLTKLKDKLKKFTQGEAVVFPRYSRKLHAPVDDSFTVTASNALLLLAGLWFLRDDGSWASVRKFISYHFYLTGPSEELRANTIARHVRGGRSKKEAEAFYDQSDKVNMENIQSNSVPANETPPYFGSI